MRERLLTPGPVALHPQASAVLSEPQTYHRDAAAKAEVLRARQLLAQALATEGQVLLMTGSGTLGMDALVSNLFSPGERVYVPVSGKFSERWAEIATAEGLEVIREDFPWGRALDPAAIATSLRKADPVGILLTHSESSTGVLNDVRAIVAASRGVSPEILVGVDMITSLMVTEARLEAWDIDAAVAGSQKGLMCPPGLALVALAPRALARLKPRGYYLDLARELKAQKSGETAFTPAINLIRAVRAVAECEVPRLPELISERWTQNETLYQAGEAQGLKPVPDRRSPACAAFWLPEGVEYGQIKAAFAKRGALIAGGQGQFSGKIFRISLMGYYDRFDAQAVAEILQEVATEIG